MFGGLEVWGFGGLGAWGFGGLGFWGFGVWGFGVWGLGVWGFGGFGGSSSVKAARIGSLALTVNLRTEQYRGPTEQLGLSKFSNIR